MSIGERIKQARKRKGFTQKELADKVGINKNTICGYEAGHREPDALKINALSKALGVTGDWLLETPFAEQLDESANAQQPSISPDAMKVALDYDSLDYRGKYAVRSVLDAECAYLRRRTDNSDANTPEMQAYLDRRKQEPG